MKCGLIYAATNINNDKMYIGQTINFDNRRWKHRSVARNKNTENMSRFQKSIKKHGYESFVWEILCEVRSDNMQILKKMLDHWECKFIYRYDTYGKGYNDTRGGSGSVGTKHKKSSICKIRKARAKQVIVCSDETKSKISKTLTGHHMSNETKEKISKSHRGKILSKETRAKISKNSAMRRPEVAKKVSDALSKEWLIIKPNGTEEIITNLKKYCMLNDLSNGHMVEVSQGKRKQYKNYRCKKLLTERKR